MTTITIRDVPQEVRDQLAARASREGRSMQSYLLELLTTTAGRPTMAEILDGIRDDVARSGSTVTSQSILDMLDDDRRR